MYTPPYFEAPGKETLSAILPEASFATLITSDDAGCPIATHLPLNYSEEEGEFGALYGHVAKANSHWKLFSGRNSLAIFQGPHAYISPRYYASEINVPTWNYVAVHAYGEIEILDKASDVLDVLKDLTDENEKGRAEPWTVEAFDQKRLKAMAQAIVAFRLPISRLEAKAKLGQNKKADDKQALAEALQQTDLHDWQTGIL
ncbi:FMN-binding negative transcriptional regulator [Sneathiella limimaris]|uniref:FMN-binding negative transcriptional regulator n=1 Tax=Sneathiella limimaris TaxID=1964213 RepID=UPI00146B5C5D|nr:FMN-binding negative transcriptional regulator [Sneathiella limimaris]